MRGILKTSIAVLFVAVVLAVVVSLATAPCAPGKLALVDCAGNGTDISEEVRQDASRLASELCGGTDSCQDVEDGLLEVFSCGVGRDFVLIFNSGGQGQEEIGPEWGSIIDGIQQELQGLGYTTMLVIYDRTPGGFWDFLKELRETFTAYSAKAGPLAAQVNFLTGHFQSTRVLLLGESAGSILSNEAIRLLEADSNVYSIQTGLPCIYRGPALSEQRALVINDNGISPDSLSNGDLWTIFRANLGRIPTYRPEEGHFLFYMRTPGHIYTWEHPGVRSRVTLFLEDHFGGN